jgi:hypothetical protein
MLKRVKEVDYIVFILYIKVMIKNTLARLRPIVPLLGLISFFALCTWLRAYVIPYDSISVDFTVEVFQVTAGVFTVQYILDLFSDIFNKEA